MNILIVDDEEIEREALKHFFSINDLEMKVVGEACNGLEAIDLNIKLKPDIIILDIRMRILDGLSALEIIKKDNPSTEIVILTAYGLFEYAQQAIRNNVFDFILKPVNNNDLLKCLLKLKHYIIKKAGTNEITTNNLLEYWLKEKYNIDENKIKDDKISFIIQYLISNNNENVSVKHLASLLYINPSYLSRFFKIKTGMTLKSFIVSIKMENAKILLKDRNLSIKKIAFELGFVSVQHFSNTFKKVERYSPTHYRLEEGKLN